jgi:hypothetical protein
MLLGVAMVKAELVFEVVKGRGRVEVCSVGFGNGRVLRVMKTMIGLVSRHDCDRDLGRFYL